MKKFQISCTILFINFFSLSAGWAQAIDPAWYTPENPGTARQAAADQLKLQDGKIPMAFQIIDQDASVLSDQKVRELATQAAKYFNHQNSGKKSLTFYVDSIQRVRIPWMTYPVDSADEVKTVLREAQKDPSTSNKLNIAIAQSALFCGATYGLGYSLQGIVMGTSSDCFFGDVLAHEIGHFFGVLHPHDYFATLSRGEKVSGDECRVRGDQICDTPADPMLMGKVKLESNNECVYSPNRSYYDSTSDEVISPDVYNIMSYTIQPCRRRFTSGQLDKMYETFLLRTQSNTREINRKNPLTLKVYPNPVKVGQNVVIELDFSNLDGVLDGKDFDPHKTFTPIIYNSAGLMVQHNEKVFLSNEYTLDGHDGVAWNIRFMAQGTYYIHMVSNVKSNDNKIMPAKIIVGN